MTRIALAGFGAIGESIASHLGEFPIDGVELVGVCLRPEQLARARALVGGQAVLSTVLGDILDRSPDIIIEAAGQRFAREHGAEILSRGCDLHLLSVGVLAHDAFREELEHCARSHATAVVIPAGALGGFDALLSMRAAGLQSVSYTSIKPPLAWRGTRAERMVDLDCLTEPRILLDASARDAALLFPQNANLAAAVAIAGIGLDETRVQLIADPGATGNIGQLVAQSTLGRLDVTLAGGGFGGNPKTSRITGFSVVAGLRNESAAIRFL